MESKKWFALVKYDDVGQNQEIVPAENVKNLVLPIYSKSEFYDCFWDPKHVSLSEARKYLREEPPTFPRGSGYSGGPGYHKARVLFVGR